MLEFFVKGRPVPAGSKSGHAIRYNLENIPADDDHTCRTCGFTGQVTVSDVSGKRGIAWRKEVQQMAIHCCLGQTILGVVSFEFHFFLHRPLKHYRTGQFAEDLNKHAPAAWDMGTTPDATKLTRAVEDALNGVLWKDDCQAVEQAVTKQWSCRYREQEGVLIIVAPFVPSENVQPELTF